MRATTTIKGTAALTQSGLSGTVTLDRTEDMTLSGLLSGNHTLNGTGIGKADVSTTLGATTSRSTITDAFECRCSAASRAG